jgi:hypothetical protein
MSGISDDGIGPNIWVQSGFVHPYDEVELLSVTTFSEHTLHLLAAPAHVNVNSLNNTPTPDTSRT